MAGAPANPRGRRSEKKAVRRANTRTALNMRIRPELRDLIDEAAEVAGKNRTDFVLDAARQAAQATLLDQVHVKLSPKAYTAFVERLDAPPQTNELLRKTMRTPPVWA